MSKNPETAHASVQQAVHGASLENVFFENIKRLNWLWKLLIAFTLFFFGYITSYIHVFQSDQFFVNIRQGSYTKFFFYTTVCTTLYIIYDSKAHTMLDKIAQQKWLSLKYQEKQKRRQRAVTMVKFLIAIFYYLGTSITGYYLLKQSTSLPSWLGGNGQIVNMFIRDPIQLKGTMLAQFYLFVCMGKHFARLLLHVFKTSQGSYYSFTLHHIVSIFLIAFCYLMNFWTIGTFILVIHDCSDFVNSIVRFYIELRWESSILTSFLGAALAITWIGARNIIYPICCLYPIFEAYQIGPPLYEQKIVSVFYIPGLVGSGMLFILEVLHIVWTYALINYFKVKLTTSSKGKSQ